LGTFLGTKSLRYLENWRDGQSETQQE
jgi:hypothetical protein